MAKTPGKLRQQLAMHFELRLDHSGRQNIFSCAAENDIRRFAYPRQYCFRAADWNCS